MTREEELVLRVKFQDTYKAVVNYIRNGLGIKREDVEKYLEGFARDAVAKYDFYPAIKDIIEQKMVEVFREKYSYTPGVGLKRHMENVIKTEVARQVSEIVKEQVRVVLKEDG